MQPCTSRSRCVPLFPGTTLPLVTRKQIEAAVTYAGTATVNMSMILTKETARMSPEDHAAMSDTVQSLLEKICGISSH